MTTEKLILFLDDKNFYNGARRAFFSTTDAHFYGQINPIALGEAICARPAKTQRQLQEVRIYTGLPDSTKEPKTYSAHMEQCQSWKRDGAEVITRMLRYPLDWPNSKAQQKGIDVALAVDFVALAIEGEYDIGVIASTDSDLRPALEYVKKKCSNHCRVEVTAWSSPRTKSRLSIPGVNVWCHWLNEVDYDVMADLTDYNI